MNRKETLQKLYSEIEADSTMERVNLSDLKNGLLTDSEINDLFDDLKTNGVDAAKLDSIKNYENNLLTLYSDYIDEVEEMCQDLLGHEYTVENELRAKFLLNELNEIVEAMEVAYFQIGNEYQDYEDRLDKAKEEIGHVIPGSNLG